MLFFLREMLRSITASDNLSLKICYEGVIFFFWESFNLWLKGIEP